VGRYRQCRILIALALATLSALGQEIALTRVATGLTAPTDLQNAGDGSNRLFVVEQSGIIRVLKNGVLNPDPFLDIRDKTHAGGERGLLGLAFPPGFAAKQRFYVNYTDLNGNTTIAQYRVTSNSDVADPASEIVLMTIAQPYANHNGGCLRFGPDGYLYVGMGDGGNAGDPQGNGQNRASLLGKLLRLDVETDPGRIVIPATNPFIGNSAARPEIWALGLRNPWRFSFDRATGDLWIADVGQDRYEEIDLQPAGSRGGENYGWNTMEGAHCFSATCSTDGLTLPVFEYPHTDGCSITGGSVYRGAAAPGLRGTYVYGDYCSGRIWGLQRQANTYLNRLLIASAMNISTFGEDEAGELYVANAKDGSIYRIEGSAAPRFTAAGVVNAASYTPGLVAGSLATIFVSGVRDNAGIVGAASLPLPTDLSGVSVTVDGRKAPLLSVANQNGTEQVNFQVPYETRGRAQAEITVIRDGVPSAPVTVTVLDAAPGVFTTDGVHAVAVHAADYSPVVPEHPLHAGEYVSVYATGLGAASNEPVSGTAAPLNPLSHLTAGATITIGGVNADVTFAGLAPELVGVYQINFRVPDGVPAGSPALVLKTATAAAAPVQVRTAE
jgi:uncharacterized protein (TIGR03437 family)